MMDFDSLYNIIPGNGWLSYKEARLLWTAARETEGPILEVGCYMGRSTVLLAKLGRPVYAVDPFDNFDSDLTGDEVCDLLRQNLRKCDVRNVHLFRQRIEDWDVQPAGFAYLDGDHTYEGTINQITAAILCGASRVCVHDYALTGGGKAVKRAIADSPMVLLDVVERMAHCSLSGKSLVS